MKDIDQIERRRQARTGVCPIIWVLLFIVASPLWGLRAETTNSSGATNLTPGTTMTYTSAVSITASGTYYLSQNIVCATNAITISADNVTLDLNGHSVSSFGPGATMNTAIGAEGIIVSGDHSNITIRNGSVRGYLVGIYNSYTSIPANYGYKIEGIRVMQCTSCGMQLMVTDTTIRNCSVSKVAGSSNTSGYYGIVAVNGANVNIADCDISEINSGQGNSYPSYGIAFYGSGAIGGAAFNNRISQASTGIGFISNATGKAQNNLFGAGVTTQLSGGTNAGGNF